MTDYNRPVEPVNQSLTHLALEAIGKELRQGAPYEKVGKNSRSLVRSQALSMVLMALKTGSQLKEHHAPGPATAIVLEGEVAFSSGQDEQLLKSHESVVFSADLEHGLRACQDSLVLLIIGGKD